MSFLTAQAIRGLFGKNDWPRSVEEEPEVYEREDLDTLLAVCDVLVPKSIASTSASTTVT
jgi:hypothetical protein